MKDDDPMDAPAPCRSMEPQPSIQYGVVYNITKLAHHVVERSGCISKRAQVPAIPV